MPVLVLQCHTSTSIRAITVVIVLQNMSLQGNGTVHHALNSMIEFTVPIDTDSWLFTLRLLLKN